MSLTVLSLPQRFKRILQAMMLAVAVVYMTLLLYQSAYGYPGIQVSSGFWVLSSGSEFWALQSGRLTDCVGVVSSAKLSYVCVLGDLHKFCQEKARQFALSPSYSDPDPYSDPIDDDDSCTFINQRRRFDFCSCACVRRPALAVKKPFTPLPCI